MRGGWFSPTPYTRCVGGRGEPSPSHQMDGENKATKKKNKKEKDKKLFIKGLDKQIFWCKIVNIFLPISFNICFGCSKELSQSFEHPQHMFQLRNKKINFWVPTLN